jgi:hypothetical protein
MDYVKMFDTDGCFFLLTPGEEHRLDAAKSRFLETGRNELVHLDLLDGSPFVLPVSDIQCWIMSSPAVRRRSLEIEQVLSQELEATRRELGIWSEP